KESAGFKLVGLQDLIRVLLETYKLTSIFEIHTSVAEAVSSFKKNHKKTGYLLTGCARSNISNVAMS
ncbi:MAG: hypothetical protein JXA92_02525, partial [candidate division Zixibacteria bacterium]|nr:hypothetical protein [candidate division Zixibacteria bacterium]